MKLIREKNENTKTISIPSGTTTYFFTSCTNIGTSPNEEKIKTFLRLKHYNQTTGRFENRQAQVVENDKEKAMNFSTAWEWIKGGNDSTPKEKLPESKVNIAELTNRSDKVKFVWLGHSSILINYEGTIILVDPVFSGTAAPVSFLSKRFQAPVLQLKDLPKVDIILISHDHYDHLDMETIQFFREQDVKFITPLGVGSHLEGWGIQKEKIVERDWHESHPVGGLTFTATPAQHFSGRSLTDDNKTLWASWVLKSKKHNIYFSGDSGYDVHFKEIGDKYGPFDIAFMENGQYDERWGAAHMRPEEVAIAYEELRAKKVFPIHWGMFALGMHPWYEPPKRLLKAVKSKNDVVTPKIGYIYDAGNLPFLDRWWDAFPKD